MKKLSFELIRKIDFVLVFILAAAGIVVLSVALIKELIPDRSTPNQVAVVADEDTEIKEYVEFNRKLRDVYVFDVRSSGIRAEEDFYADMKLSGSAGLSNSFGGSYGRDGVTNLLFVNGKTKEERKLFPSNVFIYKHQFEQDGEHLEFPHACNVYAVVKADTNKDKLLNSSDDVSLYVSDYDGNNLQEVSPSVIAFRFIGEDEFMFTEYDGSKLSYFVYDCKSRTKELIKSAVQEISEKEIAMW